MGLMVMRRRDPEWSSYGSEHKGGGKKTVNQMHVTVRANKGDSMIYIYANLLFTLVLWLKIF